MEESRKFHLDKEFVNGYADKTPDFGFNGLGALTYYRTYSRIIPELGRNEHWFETVKRVVEGAYTLQKKHILNNQLGWNDKKAQKSAQEMYDRMFTMKFLPPGRMIWAMGTDIVENKGIGQALFNCAFVSTEKIGSTIGNACKPFTFMMDMSMVGVGVGFDVKGERQIKINKPSRDNGVYRYKIPDSREGWVESLKLLLESYFSQHFVVDGEEIEVEFDYSLIREAGLPIKGFGGTSSGPEPLMRMHEQIREVLEKRAKTVDGRITITDITDIMNMIGQCVVAGNVRRTAQIALGNPKDHEFRELKDYQWNSDTNSYEGSNAHRSAWGWASNNSVLVDNKSNFSDLAKQTAINGEPGYVFLDNIRKYSRMSEPADYKDALVKGTNPCGEQSLESYELCCLIETFPSRAESIEDYLRTLKFAYLLGKTATLANTTWDDVNRVQKRNRRIGTSVSGVTNFIENYSLDDLRRWLELGYSTIQEWDEIYSSWLCVPKSIKTTSVKPSGTVSLLAGVNPGCHFPEYKQYIRRVRIAKNSDLIPYIEKAGLHIEDDVVDNSSLVVSFPVQNEGRTINDVSIWEQVSLAVFLQKYWSDNQVSCTVTFTEEEASQIEPILEYFKYDLKAISFLPKLEAGAYAQMPYEAISEEKYKEMNDKVTPIDFISMNKDSEGEQFCTTDVCEIRNEMNSQE